MPLRLILLATTIPFRDGLPARSLKGSALPLGVPVGGPLGLSF